MGLFSKPEAEAVEVADRALKCLICGHDRFNKREAQLNTSTMTFFKLDWANASGVWSATTAVTSIGFFQELAPVFKGKISGVDQTRVLVSPG